MKNTKTDGNQNLVDEESIEEDEIGTRVHEQFVIKTKDPYALVSIVPKNGKLPEKLKGLFTSPLEAQRAIDAYLMTTKKK